MPLAGGMLDGEEEEGAAEVTIATSTEQDARHFPIRGVAAAFGEVAGARRPES
jgi:hypothetical protein